MNKARNFKQFSDIRQLFSAAVFTVLLSFGLHHSAQAQFADSPCDPNYYKSLEARAWLEAQREITQNQNLIFKPDSVLEYTCFDKHMNVMAASAKNMFSENQDRWGAIRPEGSMGAALTGLVGAAFSDYDTSNFSHTLLGGRSDEPYEPEETISGGEYACDVMQKVWQEAKCMNFIDNESNDGFFTFAEYASGPDKRFAPTGCSNTSLWETNIKLANAENNDPWKSDSTKTYLNDIYRTDCGGSNDRFNIQTGLRVFRAKGDVTEYMERVCVVPGCFWNPTGVTQGRCER